MHEWISNPNEVALCIIDMQNDFCHSEGFLNKERRKHGKPGVDATSCLKIANNINNLINKVRPLGIKIIWIRSYYDYIFLKPSHIRQRKKEGLCLKNSWGADWFEVKPSNDDLVIEKNTYSGFQNTNLHSKLQEYGIQKIMFSGVATNVCVDSTLREAFFNGYDVAVLEDCVGSSNQIGHAGTLATVKLNFGEVLMSSELL